MEREKNLRSLLTAYAQVNEKQPATLLIVGDIRTGEDKQIFEEFKRSTPNTQMIITGFVTQQDLPVYYALMDVVLQPSLRGGLPNTLLEALTCEKLSSRHPLVGSSM